MTPSEKIRLFSPFLAELIKRLTRDWIEEKKEEKGRGNNEFFHASNAAAVGKKEKGGEREREEEKGVSPAAALITFFFLGTWLRGETEPSQALPPLLCLIWPPHCFSTPLASGAGTDGRGKGRKEGDWRVRKWGLAVQRRREVEQPRRLSLASALAVWPQPTNPTSQFAVNCPNYVTFPPFQLGPSSGRIVGT